MMRQYSVHKISRRRYSPYALILQSPSLYDLETVIVAPVRPSPGIKPITVIQIRLEIDGEYYIAELDKLSAIIKSDIGDERAYLPDIHYDVSKALDRLFSGI